jgi:hypothetical protein|tara:strand:+ start:904 stop:1149 length:246 start_codon:yes stop_codon:yes gene_type:complete
MAELPPKTKKLTFRTNDTTYTILNKLATELNVPKSTVFEAIFRLGCKEIIDPRTNNLLTEVKSTTKHSIEMILREEAKYAG